MSNAFDIVIGGGHAGCEAVDTARLGKRTLLVSLKKSTSVGCLVILLLVDCGHLVRELMCIVIIPNRRPIQSTRRLNTRKGFTVQSSRVQVDIDIYPKEMQRDFESPQHYLLRGRNRRQRTSPPK